MYDQPREARDQQVGRKSISKPRKSLLFLYPSSGVPGTSFFTSMLQYHTVCLCINMGRSDGGLRKALVDTLSLGIATCVDKGAAYCSFHLRRTLTFPAALDYRHRPTFT